MTKEEQIKILTQLDSLKDGVQKIAICKVIEKMLEVPLFCSRLADMVVYGEGIYWNTGEENGE